MSDVNALPFEVRRYIDRQHRRECDANQCDHRATSQNELDAITATVIERHGAGAAWQAQLPRALVSQCHAVYGLREQYGAGDLVEVKLDGTWVLVPLYLTIVDEVRRLAAIFVPPPASSQATEVTLRPGDVHTEVFAGLAQHLRREADCAVANCDRDPGGVDAATQQSVNQLRAWAGAVESVIAARAPAGLGDVVRAHIADLRRTADILIKELPEMTPTAREFRKASDELEAALNQDGGEKGSGNGV